MENSSAKLSEKHGQQYKADSFPLWYKKSNTTLDSLNKTKGFEFVF